MPMHAFEELSLSDRRERLTTTTGCNRLRLLHSICRDLVSRAPKQAESLLEDARRTLDALRSDPSVEAHEWRSESAETARLAGVLASRRDEYAEAVRHLEAAREGFVEAGDMRGAGKCWSELGQVYRRLGNFSRTLTLYGKALTNAREASDVIAEVGTLGDLARLYREIGDRGQAETCLLEAWQRAGAADLGDLALKSSSELAELYLEQDQLPLALPLLEDACASNEQREDLELGVAVWRNLGLFHAKRGEPEEAFRAYRKAVDLAEAASDRATRGALLLTIGHLLMDLPESQAGTLGVSTREILEEALREAEAVASRALCRRVHGALAEYFERHGIYDLAYAHLQSHGDFLREDAERKMHQQRLLLEGDQTRRELEASREMNERLRAEVERRERMESDLRNALVQARLADEVKTRFLATMSHEIRTPMNGILGMTDVLSRSALTDDQREAVDVISEAGQNLLEVITDILDLTKLEAGRVALVKDEFALSQVVQKVTRWTELKAEEKGLQFKASFDSALDKIYRGDAARWQQLLLALLDNAVKFTSAGTVSLKIEAGDAGGVRCIVEDTGIGIPADRFEQIFEVFTQLDSSTTRQYGGVGLGLAIARKLSLLLEGTLSVSSEQGVGSRFVFEAPLESAEGPDRERAPLVSSEVRRRVRVLVVEDTEFNWRVVSLLLKKLEVEASWAPDGFRALEMVENAPYDLILMDVQMPGIDGVETTRRIRQHRALPFQPRIVALTAYPLQERDDPLLAAGIDDHLTKPIDLARLREAIALTPRQGE